MRPLTEILTSEIQMAEFEYLRSCLQFIRENRVRNYTVWEEIDVTFVC
jgi:hypothetical protein